MSANALAQTSEFDLPVDLSWQGPEACTGAGETLAEIHRMLGKTPPPASLTRITVAVVARPDEGKWAIHVTTASGESSGERQLRADSCDEARRAVALLIALMIDPEAHVAASEPPVPLAPAPKPPVSDAPARSVQEKKPTVAPPTQAPKPTERDAASELAPRAHLGVELAADHGTLPSTAVGGRVDFGVAVRRWSFALRTSAWTRRSVGFSGVANTGAKVNLYDGEFAACVVGLRQDDAALNLCAGPRSYVFHASSYGVTRPGSATKLAWGAFGELALRYGLARGVAIRLGLEVLIPFQRPKFVIQDFGQVFQPYSLGERVSLGPEFEF